MAILRNKINQNHIDVPTDVVDFLAQNLQENIRQLEGVIKKLAMSNLLTGQPVNMEMVIQTVPEYLRDAEPVSDTLERIIDCVSRRYNISVDEIMGKSRKKETKTARNVAMYVVRSVTGSVSAADRTGIRPRPLDGTLQHQHDRAGDIVRSRAGSDDWGNIERDKEKLKFLFLQLSLLNSSIKSHFGFK